MKAFNHDLNKQTLVDACCLSSNEKNVENVEQS